MNITQLQAARLSEQIYYQYFRPVTHSDENEQKTLLCHATKADVNEQHGLQTKSLPEEMRKALKALKVLTYRCGGTKHYAALTGFHNLLCTLWMTGIEE